MIDNIERLAVGHLPTPLEPALNLSRTLGRELWIKRDDVTGLAGGGNKVRKLEYLAADAISKGANCLVTVGGPQSNHARMTAALSARLGLSCRLYLKGSQPETLRGNLLLNQLLGAEMIFVGSKDYPEIYQRIAVDEDEFLSRNQKPYLIPLGGSSPLGALGYVRMVLRELVPQFQEVGIKPGAIAVAAGSGGTMAGLLLGLALADWHMPVVGYSVSYPSPYLQEQVANLYNQAAKLIAVPNRISAADVRIDASTIGPGYGVATSSALEALTLFARCEGLLLDSVYTAKAAAGMIADIRRNQWPGQSVLFIHTGGWPALFAKDDVEAFLRG